MTSENHCATKGGNYLQGLAVQAGALRAWGEYPGPRIRTGGTHSIVDGQSWLSASHDRSALSARPCQPLPVARSPSATSRESRIEMGIFLGAFCGPRLRSLSNTFCSDAASAEKGLKRATSSAVIARTSPSSSINGLRTGSYVIPIGLLYILSEGSQANPKYENP